MIFRDAQIHDLPDIVRLLADDPLGSQRETPGDPAYAAALQAIDADPSGRFLVAELDGAVVGCLQLNIIPSLARRGMTLAIIESVRIDSRLRGRGFGEALVREAMRLAKLRGAGLMELATNVSRKDAHRFYERLGFQSDRIGMKLDLGQTPGAS
jgi:GNAT superfamily N-acetyltransferase